MLSATANMNLHINNKAFRSIEKRLVKSTRYAIQYYSWQVKRALLPIRSQRIKGNLRKWVVSSPEGQAPFSQTLELHNSVGFECKEVSPGIIHAACGTDVSYAPILELGGFPIHEPNRKHSKYWLVNFLKNPKQNIAARPLWIPVLQREMKIMVGLIAKI